MKRWSVAGAIALLPIATYGAGMVITPVQLGLVGAAGSTVRGVINVSSPRPQENRIRITFGDYLIDDRGHRTEVSPANAPARSCRAWLEVDQDQFVSPEQGKVPVVVSAHIPANASGSYWAEVYFQIVPAPPSFTPAGRAPLVGVQVLPRISIPVIVTVQGTEKYAMKIEKLDAAKTEDGIETSVIVQNTGNAAAMISGALAVERPSTTDASEELASKDIEPVTSYPGAKRVIKLNLPLKIVDAASADLHAYFRYGPGKDQAMEASSKLQALLESHRDADGPSSKQ